MKLAGIQRLLRNAEILSSKMQQTERSQRNALIIWWKEAVAMGGEYSLVSDVEFIQATRDTGYQSTAAAVAELVDNSVQAKASWVRIRVDEQKSGTERRITLSVLDDGHGMEVQTMRTALQFGGTRRFNDRTGLGRFGMGLPNSSLSQCRRVDVYSWQYGRQNVYRTHLDIDNVITGDTREIPKPMPSILPEWAHEFQASSGTLVAWQNCDRLDYRKASTIARKLYNGLGRKFRRFLFDGFKIFVNDELLVPVDPLFLHEGAALTGATEPFPPLEYRVRIPAAKKRSSTIVVRFSLLPISQWHEWSAAQKRRYGISGGAGVSVIRAGREVAYGWYFMGSKRRQNYDDWWRCEIAFEPELDEWFGVTHSKQGINPTQDLRAFLSPDIESIAHQLNARVQTEFARARGPKRAKSVRNAEQKDWLLPRLPHTIGSGSQERSLAALKQREGLQYKIEVHPTAEPEFFTWQLTGNTLLVQINEDHPFYFNVYQSAVEGEDLSVLFHLECLLLSFARSEAQWSGHANASECNSIREKWSHILAALLS